jgi:hypothetical protein
MPLDKYDDYVDHPRFGRRPKITGLNPDPLSPGVHLHWNALTQAEFEEWTGRKWPAYDLSTRKIVRIPHTAIAADLTRQTPATVAVTHYFDLERECVECAAPFIFFAAEQKYWYEELGFGLESDCVRCVPCRKTQQGIVRTQHRYEELFHKYDRTAGESMEMAECCLSLIEASMFGPRQTQQVRMLLNRIPAGTASEVLIRRERLLSRLRELENRTP